MSTDSPINQTNLALAALAACIVQALDEQQAGVRSKFEASLEKAYHSLRDGKLADTECLETLHWTQHILKVLA
jgi:hypothetical protein